MRERYSQKVIILRRDKTDGSRQGPEALDPGQDGRDNLAAQRRVANSGGYYKPTYNFLAETSCQVRDESPEEYAAAESSTIGHVRTFAMRERDIREDDLLVWHGEEHRVRRIDRLYNRGREILVRASVPKSRYSLPGM